MRAGRAGQAEAVAGGACPVCPVLTAAGLLGAGSAAGMSEASDRTLHGHPGLRRRCRTWSKCPSPAAATSALGLGRPGLVTEEFLNGSAELTAMKMSL